MPLVSSAPPVDLFPSGTDSCLAHELPEAVWLSVGCLRDSSGARKDRLIIPFVDHPCHLPEVLEWSELDDISPLVDRS